VSDDTYRASQAPPRPKTEVFSPLRPLRHFAADTMAEQPATEAVIEGSSGCLFWFATVAMLVVGFMACGFTSDGINSLLGRQVLASVHCAGWGAVIGAVAPTGLLLLHRYLRSVLHFDDDQVREWWLAKIRGS